MALILLWLLGAPLTLIVILFLLGVGSLNRQRGRPPSRAAPPTFPHEMDDVRVVARILVVEDHEDSRAGLALWLEIVGHTVEASGDDGRRQLTLVVGELRVLVDERYERPRPFGQDGSGGQRCTEFHVVDSSCRSNDPFCLLHTADLAV